MALRVWPSENRGMSVRPPPHAYFVVSAIFHYLGPALAVLLFARVGVLGVAWLRIATAALVFVAWRRPWRVRLDRPAWLLLTAWATVLAAMNSVFYLAIDRLPLGTVAAIEFLPVVALAAASARSFRNGLALVAAVAGVWLLTDVRLVSEPLGLLFAAANAALFAAYIVLGHRVARDDRMSGLDGLALSMIIAAVLALPLGLGAAAPAFADPILLPAAAGVGICSSVVPYVADQLAMARLPRATYALMIALLPATATVIGVIVLTQIPTAAEITGIVLVVAGVAVHRSRPTESEPHRSPARETSEHPAGSGPHRSPARETPGPPSEPGPHRSTARRTNG
ncbi:EamA family transporter [Symbioplanes lichenis]|uniref:EamA family transporter n=1 Tax=Symbioplanes lichenis TaxID=1629072 RepID=UPI00273996F0|nr:EamA family transporter [Actinoplanes lichenis]